MHKGKWYSLLKRYGYENFYYVWKIFNLNPRLKEPIFVIGYPRSGTFIFAELLGKHPDVVNYSEAGKVWDPLNYNPESDHLWTKRDVTEADSTRIISRFEFKRWLFRANDLLTNIQEIQLELII